MRCLIRIQMFVPKLRKGCYHEIGNDRLKETSLHYLSTPWKTKSQESILLINGSVILQLIDEGERKKCFQLGILAQHIQAKSAEHQCEERGIIQTAFSSHNLVCPSKKGPSKQVIETNKPTFPHRTISPRIKHCILHHIC